MEIPRGMKHRNTAKMKQNPAKKSMVSGYRKKEYSASDNSPPASPRIATMDRILPGLHRIAPL